MELWHLCSTLFNRKSSMGNDGRCRRRRTQPDPTFRWPVLVSNCKPPSCPFPGGGCPTISFAVPSENAITSRLVVPPEGSESNRTSISIEKNIKMEQLRLSDFYLCRRSFSHFLPTPPVVSPTNTTPTPALVDVVPVTPRPGWVEDPPDLRFPWRCPTDLAPSWDPILQTLAALAAG